MSGTCAKSGCRGAYCGLFGYTDSMVCLVCKRGMGRMSTGESAVGRDGILNSKRKVRRLVEIC